jgi:D-lactate dehydrogenase (cytochrome)
MARVVVRASAPWSEATPPCEISLDPELLEAHARDAAGLAFGGPEGILLPRSEATLARWLAEHPAQRILAQGALTSLTGGASPDHEIVVSLRRMDALAVEGLTARVGPGLLLATLDEALRERGLQYPPAPTHDGASIGGNVSTNAAGAATFRYGTTRDWVSNLRVLLRDGRLLVLGRGETFVRPGDTLVIEGPRPTEAPLPRHLTPPLRKISAGYWMRDPMDLVDLFLGAEGTLGIVTGIGLRLAPRPGILCGFVLLPSEALALALCAALREGEAGLPTRSVEFFDRACLAFLEAHGGSLAWRGHAHREASAALLFELELPAGTEEGEGIEGVASLMERFGLQDRCELALPSARTRRRELLALREALPLALSEWLLRRQRADPAIRKAGGDPIVPFAEVGRLLDGCRRVFAARGLEACVFGHLSDGNLHPNVLPRNAEELGSAWEAQLEIGALARSLGGCPLAEHGVGRSPLKKELLRRFWGEEVLEGMRRLKLALDPGATLARGVLFDP